MRPIAVAARLVLAASLLATGAIQAQAQAADPPGRVGRLSVIDGTVSYRQPEQEQWAPAVLNYPVTQGMSFWTEPGARAEIQTGGANVRLDQSTELDVARLDDDATQLRVEQGSVNVQLGSVQPGGVSVLTPQGEASLLRPGRYRIDAAPEQSQVSVLEGEARVGQNRANVELRSGESAVLAGDGFTRREAQATPLDDWALERERQLAAAAQSDSGRYVSRAIPGYQDLENHGRWRTVSDLGPVWYPTVTPNWAPYRYGHWAYVPPWGWTWIDDAPWGFAPFHYGRWVHDDWGWGWHPGPVVARPVYAPALVAFVGGAGWGVSIASGPRAAVGWVPLGPREVFRPYYRASRHHIHNVNIAHVNKTVINNVTVNRTRNVTVNNFANQRAATVVPTAAFTRAAKVQQATVALPREQLAKAPVATQLTHLKPTPAARAGSAPAEANRSVTPAPNAPARVSQQPVRERPVAADAPAPKAPGPAPRQQAATPRQDARPNAGARPQAAPQPVQRDDSLSRIAPAAGPTPPPAETRRSDQPQARPQTQSAPAPAPRQAPEPEDRRAPAPRAAQPSPPASAQPPAPPKFPSAPAVAQPPRREAAEPPQPQSRPAPAQPTARPAPSPPQSSAPAPQARPSPPATTPPSARTAPPPREPAPPPTVRAEPPRPASPPPPAARAEPPRPAPPPPPAARAEPPRPAPPPPPAARAEPPRPMPPPAARAAPPPPAPPPQAAPQRAPAKPASPQQDERQKRGG